MDTGKTEFDYQKIIDDLESFDERMCCAILLGHLQSIAKRCDINPDEYNDSASLTCAIADVLDERLATPDKILCIEQYSDGTSFVQYRNGWSYGYQNLLNHKKCIEKINENTIHWVNLGKAVEELTS